MRKTNFVTYFLAAAILLGLGTAANAQRITREELTRSRSGTSSQTKTAPINSNDLIADTSSLKAENSGTTDKKVMVGTWLETVIFSGPDPMPPLKSLSTFTADGGLVVADQGAVTAEMEFSPGHGSWAHLGGRTFAWSVMEIISDPSDGALSGFLKVNGTYIVNESGDAYTGNFVATVSAPDGTALFTVEGTNVGARLPLEVLPQLRRTASKP